MSRLTIITPTLNQASFIEYTIRSVVSQMGKDDVYVIVDGGSTDETHEILQRWSDQISAVHIIEGCSQAEALRFGFEKYPADYACYLNSDDMFLPGAVRRGLFALASTSANEVGVYSDRVFVDDANDVTGIWRLCAHHNYLMRRWDYIPQETCFWKYDAMQQCGGIDASKAFAMDYDLFVRMMQLGSFRHQRDFWSTFRAHNASKTHLLGHSVGKSEVAIVQKKNDIQMGFLDRCVGFGLRKFVECGSTLSFTPDLRESLQQQVMVATAGE